LKSKTKISPRRHGDAEKTGGRASLKREIGCTRANASTHFIVRTGELWRLCSLMACELRRDPMLASTILLRRRSMSSSRGTGKSIARANCSSSLLFSSNDCNKCNFFSRSEIPKLTSNRRQLFLCRRHRPQSSPRKPRNPKKSKRKRLPASLRFTETKRGKTTVRRYRGRRFYRFEEIGGKTVDFVEVFTAGEYHAIDVRFQDKTALLILASSWKPNSPIGRPATGVPSSAGR
jgi:hypothetical protein